MGTELISVVVPIYNVELYLERCVKSLLAQTYTNIEIILVDDGSKDSSGVIADELGKIDNRIRVFHKDNGGLSDARNYGAKHARGEYISFVDSDDFVDEEFLEVLYNTMLSTNTKISSVGYKMFWDLQEIKKDTREFSAQVFEGEQAIERLYSNDGYGNYAWNKLYRKELFESIQYPFGRKMEDMGTTYLLIEKSEKISFVSRELYFYFQRENSILHVPDIQLRTDKYDMCYERYKYVKERYPNMEVNYLQYFNVAVDSYCYLSAPDRELLKREIANIWKYVKRKCTIKKKIKYVLLKIAPQILRRVGEK